MATCLPHPECPLRGTLILFLDLNGVQWHPDPPNVDDAEAAMLGAAAHEVDEPWVADWLHARADFPSGAV